MASRYFSFEALELPTILIFSGSSCVHKEFDRLDVPAFATFSKFNFLFNLVLLRGQAVAFRCLSLA